MSCSLTILTLALFTSHELMSAKRGGTRIHLPDFYSLNAGVSVCVCVCLGTSMLDHDAKRLNPFHPRVGKLRYGAYM